MERSFRNRADRQRYRSTENEVNFTTHLQETGTIPRIHFCCTGKRPDPPPFQINASQTSARSRDTTRPHPPRTSRGCARHRWIADHPGLSIHCGRHETAHPGIRDNCRSGSLCGGRAGKGSRRAVLFLHFLVSPGWMARAHHQLDRRARGAEARHWTTSRRRRGRICLDGRLRAGGSHQR